MNWTHPFRRLVAAAFAGAVLLGFGCASIRDYYANDHSWISDRQYAVARELFIQTGSLDLVEKRLVEFEWQRPERNEALYRLRKEFEVLPEEVALAARPAVPSRKPAIATETTTETGHLQIPIESVVPAKLRAPKKP